MSFSFFKNELNIDKLTKYLMSNYVIAESDKTEIGLLLSFIVRDELPTKEEVAEVKFILDEIYYSEVCKEDDSLKLYLSLLFIYGVSMGEDGEGNVYPLDIIKDYITKNSGKIIDNILNIIIQCKYNLVGIGEDESEAYGCVEELINICEKGKGSADEY